jgi:hypothetical protein
MGSLDQTCNRAMADSLLLTLTLEGAAAGTAEEKREVEATMAGLVADLNGIEAVRASSVASEAVEPGSKSLGTLLLGALTAEVDGELVAMKVVRHLCSLLMEQPHPIRLTLTRKTQDGADVTVELEGSPRNQATMMELLTEAENVVRRLS